MPAAYLITNTGTRDGDEVPQLYIRDLKASLVRPVLELAGFRRVHLRAGQSKRLKFTLPLSQLAFLDQNMNWKIEAGDMEIFIGSSAVDIRNPLRYLMRLNYRHE